jgi:hypothetical protein
MTTFKAENEKVKLLNEPNGPVDTDEPVENAL